MTVFDGRKAIWMWMLAEQAEKTIADVYATAEELAGCDLVLVKAMDGEQWMADFDAGGVSRATWPDWRAAGAVPWVVPHGWNPNEEAQAHAVLSTVLMIDLEPYNEFWTGPRKNLRPYLQALRDEGVRELHVSVDPRRVFDGSFPDNCLDLIDGLHPQVYWTDFGQPAMDVYDATFRPLLDLGLPVYPVLPGNGRAGDLITFWVTARQGGCTGLSAWRLGSMDGAHLGYIKNLEVAPMPEPDTFEDARLREALVKRFEAARVGIKTAMAGLAQVYEALDPAVVPGEDTRYSADSGRVEAQERPLGLKVEESRGG